MALRQTQAVVEVLVEPIPNLRLTQAAVEVLIGPTEPNLRQTQAVIEVLIAPSTSTNPCADIWTFPEPNPYPFPNNGGPRYLRFQEMKPEWNEYGGAFPDGTEQFNTIQTTQCRYFEIDYDALTIEEAALLDAHFYSTRGGISFTVTLPRTGEVLTGVRYESYKRSPHRKYYIQKRTVVLKKATN